MKLLAVDTSTAAGSLALLDGEQVMAQWSLLSAQTHNRRLLKSIDFLLHEAGWTLHEVDAFAVTTGPGSFTGLRIGLSTMKTLAWALNKSYVGIPTLDALAAPLGFASLPVCPLLDARKKEVYYALYQPDGKGLLHRQGSYVVGPPENVLKEITGPTLFCGDGWLLYRHLFEKVPGHWIVEVPAPYHTIQAAFVGELARRRLTTGQGDNPVTSTPLYVRPSEAELKYPHLTSPPED